MTKTIYVCQACGNTTDQPQAEGWYVERNYNPTAEPGEIVIMCTPDRSDVTVVENEFERIEQTQGYEAAKEYYNHNHR